MITQSMFREIKNPNHPFIICYHLLKCHTAKWFCGLHAQINVHSSKLHVVEVILYHTAFPRNSSFTLEYHIVVLICYAFHIV